MTLPTTLHFEGLPDEKPQMLWESSPKCMRRWARVRGRYHRKPYKGEWYVSGAIPAAYKAPNDLTSEYLVVKPIGGRLCPYCKQPMEPAA